MFNSPMHVNCPTRLYVLSDVVKLSQYRGKSVNIAVVYSNYPSAYMKVFYDGVFFKSVPINPAMFNNLETKTAYLGRSSSIRNGKGIDAQFDEFRIYFGEISKTDAQNLFLVGADPSHVTISSEHTESDIHLTFYLLLLPLFIIIVVTIIAILLLLFYLLFYVLFYLLLLL